MSSQGITSIARSHPEGDTRACIKCNDYSIWLMSRYFTQNHMMVELEESVKL